MPDTNWHVYSLTSTGTTTTIGVDSIEDVSTVANAATIGFVLGQGRGGYTPLEVAEYAIFPALSTSARAQEVANYRILYGI